MKTDNAMSTESHAIAVSVVIVVYDMPRAAPRAIESLMTPYQQDMDADDYEVIVVENGSSQRLEESRPRRARHRYRDRSGLVRGILFCNESFGRP